MRSLLTLLSLAGLFSPAVPTDDESNPINKHLGAAWKEESLEPAPIAGDEEFLRRACLDLVGQVPDSREIREFTLSSREDKRALKMDELLSSWWFARTLSERMTAYLVGYPRAFDTAIDYKGFRNWLQERLKNDKTDDYAEIALELLTVRIGRGASYYRQFGEYGQGGSVLKIEQLAGRTTEAFLGYRIRCAQCHDHPFDKWTQDDFFGVAAFFSKTTLGDAAMGGNSDITDHEAPHAYTFEKYKGRLAPRYIDGTQPASGNWRAELARLIVADRQFARSFVNRVWAWFMGAGIVDPVDEFTDRNPPVLPGLLEALTDDFIEHRHDIRHLVRTIVLSKAYQRTSRKAEKDDPRVLKQFGRARIRPMTPEQLFNSISHATGLVPTVL